MIIKCYWDWVVDWQFIIVCWKITSMTPMDYKNYLQNIDEPKNGY